MPRKGKGRGKTISGAPSATLVSPVNAPYGAGERALEAQRRTPVPSGPPPVPGGGAAGVTASGAGPSPSPGGLAPEQRLDAALRAISRMKPSVGLYSPTQRPDEPLTAGLPIGAGPGPEVINSGDRVVRTLELLANASGDFTFQHLADVARRYGGG